MASTNFQFKKASTGLTPGGTFDGTAITTAGTITGGWHDNVLGANTLTITCKMANPATEVGDTCDVYIDGDYSGVVVNLVHFAQIVGNGGAKTFQAVVSNNIPATTTAPSADVSSDAAAGAIRQHGVPALIRARVVTVDATTAGNMSFPLTLTCVATD